MAEFNEVIYYKDQPYNRYKFVNEKKLTQNFYSANYVPSSQGMESSDNQKAKNSEMDDMDSIKEYQ